MGRKVCQIEHECGCVPSNPRWDKAYRLFVTGSIGVTLQSAQYPLNRVKLLLQNDSEIVRAGRLTEPYKSAADVFAQVNRSEGLAMLWRGNLAGLTAHFPGMVIAVGMRNFLQRFFGPKPDSSGPGRWFKNVAIGGVSGVTALTLIYSMTYAHARLACDVKQSSLVEGAPERQFNSIYDVYRKTLKIDGFRGLYRGYALSCFGVFAYRGIHYGFYDSLRPIFLRENPSRAKTYAVGVVTSVFAGFLTYPIDTVRHRMLMRSCEDVKYKGTKDCVMQIFKAEGYKAFMRGAGINVLRGMLGGVFLVLFSRQLEMSASWRLPK